jgi:hypothetical protein
VPRGDRRPQVRPNPAVVATGTGTKQIKTADLIRVDADTGTILARD